MTTTPGGALPSTALTELSERQRQRALDRYQALRPHLEEDVPLARVAMEAALPLRTAQDWVSRYRRFGLAGLTRAGRADQGKRRRLWTVRLTQTPYCHKEILVVISMD